MPLAAPECGEPLVPVQGTWYGSRQSLADQGDVSVAGKPGALVEPAGTGLVAAGPDIPVLDVARRP